MGMAYSLVFVPTAYRFVEGSVRSLIELEDSGKMGSDFAEPKILLKSTLQAVQIQRRTRTSCTQTDLSLTDI